MHGSRAFCSISQDSCNEIIFIWFTIFYCQLLLMVCCVNIATPQTRKRKNLVWYNSH